MAQFFLEWKIFEINLSRNSKQTFHIQERFFRKSCRLWNNVERYDTAGQDTDDNVILRMRFACWITMATNTKSEFLILTADPQQWLFERASKLCLQMHCPSSHSESHQQHIHHPFQPQLKQSIIIPKTVNVRLKYFPYRMPCIYL